MFEAASGRANHYPNKHVLVCRPVLHAFVKALSPVQSMRFSKLWSLACCAT